MGTLELSHVLKHYRGLGETVRAADGVSLSITPGEFVALYGPSGSGKTTLLLMAAAIVQPDEGKVIFDGRQVNGLSAREGARYRRQDIGVIFQSFHLAGGASALDNAAMKLLAHGMTLSEAARTARPWLERVGLGERLEQRTADMSTGERQRVAIARALASSPRLLLADEPTGNLDTQRSREIIAMLADISRDWNIPVLLATHDPQATSFADSVYTLRDGRLAAGLDMK
jgi:putative ABC transport system ATP-binding protein